MGVWEQSPWSGGQGGKAPLKLKAFYCRREQICHSHLLNFAAICRKGPERRSGDQKKEQEWRSGAFRLETNPGTPSDSEKCHD